MKQLEELEEKFLNEIKPLINQFIEIRKQQLSLEKRMECVNIRKEVQIKTSEFIRMYKEKLNKEIERIKVENLQINKQRAEEVKNLIQARENMLVRNETIKQAKGEEKYNLYLTQKEEIDQFNKMKQQCKEKQEEYKSNIEQIEKIKKAQTEFEERYGVIDYISEREMYRLANIIDSQEEGIVLQMSDGQAYDENGNIIRNVEDIKNVEQRVTTYREERFKEIQKRIAQEVLEQKKREYQEYIEEQMKKLEETIDEEIKDESTIEDNKNKDNSKKGKISLWQRFKSIFRKRNVPFLEEGKEQEVKHNNKFFESIQKRMPTLEQQSKYTKEILDNIQKRMPTSKQQKGIRNKGKDIKTEEEREKFEDVLFLLD